MARVKAYGTLSNEHRSVAVGGRRSNSVVSAWLNTDNCEQADCGLSASARVTPGGVSLFGVELPSQAGLACATHITIDGRNPRPPKLQRRIPLAELMLSYERYANIELPGGVSLGYALACVAYCESTAGPEIRELADNDKQRRNLIRS